MYDPKIGFRAVGNKVLVNLVDTFEGLPCPSGEYFDLAWKTRLLELGVIACEPFRRQKAAEIARGQTPSAAYRRGAKMSQSPTTFDCSSLVKWAYAQTGLWLPRLAIEQHACCEPVDPDCCRPDSAGGDDGTMVYPLPFAGLMSGDLIFTKGYAPKTRFWTEEDKPIGHVGIVEWQYVGGIDSRYWHIVHASNSGIRTESLNEFLARESHVSFGRPVPHSSTTVERIQSRKLIEQWYVVTVPDNWEMENAGKLRWLVLQ